MRDGFYLYVCYPGAQSPECWVASDPSANAVMVTLQLTKNPAYAHRFETWNLASNASYFLQHNFGLATTVYRVPWHRDA